MSGYARRLASAQPERKRGREDDEIDEVEEVTSFYARSSLKDDQRKSKHPSIDEPNIWFQPPAPTPPPTEVMMQDASVAGQLTLVRQLQKQHYQRMKDLEKRGSPRSAPSPSYISPDSGLSTASSPYHAFSPVVFTGGASNDEAVLSDSQQEERNRYLRALHGEWLERRRRQQEQEQEEYQRQHMLYGPQDYLHEHDGVESHEMGVGSGGQYQQQQEQSQGDEQEEDEL